MATKLRVVAMDLGLIVGPDSSGNWGQAGGAMLGPGSESGGEEK